MKFFRLLSISLALAATLVGCSTVEDEIKVTSLELDAVEVTLGGSVGNSATVSFTTDADASTVGAVFSSCTWAQASVSNGVVTILATSANTSNSRTAILTIYAGDNTVVTKPVTVTQEVYTATTTTTTPDPEPDTDTPAESVSLAVYDYYEGGLVYWVSDDGTQAKIISIFEANSDTGDAKQAWSTESVEIAGNDSTMEEGSELTAAIVATSTYSAAVYPATAYCVDRTDYTDWYLPSRTEWDTILVLYGSDPTTFEAAMAACDGSIPLTIGQYFHSSNQGADDNAAAKNISIKINSGDTATMIGTWNKTGERYVRCGRTINL